MRYLREHNLPILKHRHYRQFVGECQELLVNHFFGQIVEKAKHLFELRLVDSGLFKGIEPKLLRPEYKRVLVLAADPVLAGLKQRSSNV